MIFLFKPSLPQRRMVSPAATVAAPIFRVRFYSSLPQRRMARLQSATTPIAASILDFRLRLGNRCKVFLRISPNAAVILDFRPRLGNRCKDFPGISPNAAVILDFRPRLENRCRETLMNAPVAAW